MDISFGFFFPVLNFGVVISRCADIWKKHGHSKHNSNSSSSCCSATSICHKLQMVPLDV